MVFSSRTRRRLRSRKKPDQEAYRDPFEVIGPVPKTSSYQWIAYEVLGQELAAACAYDRCTQAGWKPVPARRHPQMPRDKKGRIVHGGQVLMERRAKDVAVARADEEKRAREQFEHAKPQLRSGSMPSWKEIDPVAAHYRTPKITDEQRKAWDDEVKRHGDLQYAVCDVSIGIIITANERDVAEHLGIGPREYAFRKFLMRADVMQLQNDHGSQRGHVKIFDLVRLTTENDK